MKEAEVEKKVDALLHYSGAVNCPRCGERWEALQYVQFRVQELVDFDPSAPAEWGTGWVTTSLETDWTMKCPACGYWKEQEGELQLLTDREFVISGREDEFPSPDPESAICPQCGGKGKVISLQVWREQSRPEGYGFWLTEEEGIDWRLECENGHRWWLDSRHTPSLLEILRDGVGSLIGF